MIKLYDQTVFTLGQIVVTAKALKVINHDAIVSGLTRHARCDWGDLDLEDRDLNDYALVEMDLLLSVYCHNYGENKFWIVTEADRSVTTVLLPFESCPATNGWLLKWRPVHTLAACLPLSIEISEEAFIDHFPLIPNHLNQHAPFDWGNGFGTMYETYGEEWEYIRTQPATNVWTLVETDSGLTLISGFAFVNRLGYFVSTEPVPESVTIEVSLDAVPQ